MEEWKPIKGYEELYSISNYGNVKNKQRLLIKGICKGYNNIVLSKDGIKKTFILHRLVAEHFIKNPDNKKQINHKDLNKLNNNVSNLEWCTPKENMTHAKEKGVMKSIAKYNEYHPKSKLTNQQALEIRELHKNGYKNNQLAVMYNVSKNCMSRLLRNITYNL